MTDDEAKKLAAELRSDMASIAVRMTKLSMKGFIVEASIDGTPHASPSGRTMYQYYPTLSISRKII